MSETSYDREKIQLDKSISSVSSSSKQTIPLRVGIVSNVSFSVGGPVGIEGTQKPQYRKVESLNDLNA
jgi:hypothetical protein